MERAFADAGPAEIENKNYATYQLRLLGQTSQTALDRVIDTVSRGLWGFGLKPMRVMTWLALLIAVCALAYGTQIRAAEAGIRAQFASALEFGARTAWSFSYGYGNSRNTLFRSITLMENIAAKTCFALFLYALSNTSPSLNELVKKLIPA